MKFKGVGVSSGIGIGKISIWENPVFHFQKYHIEENKIEEEISRFLKSIEITKKEIVETQKKVKKETGKKYAEIFSIHLSLLEDNFLINNTINLIKEEKINCESALTSVIQNLATSFQQTTDSFLKDRKRDLLDVAEKLFSNLKPSFQEETKKLKGEIIVAFDLSPSQIASIDKNSTFGFTTELGSKTSHMAIIARALEIPAVVGVDNIIGKVKDGDIAIVDGDEGVVIVNPSYSILRKYQKKKKELLNFKKHLFFLKNLPAQTLDGKKIKLQANIEFPEEVYSVKKYGGEGIGLYRTEYLYLNRNDLPSEEEQFKAYKKVAQVMGSKSVIIRTLDIGGDKFSSLFNLPMELNPFLGWRAIRFCLERKDIFQIQLRAILRAASYGNLKIMFPMISTLDEVLEVKEFLKDVKKKLKKENKTFKEDIEIGIMVEIPSSAIISRELAKHVNFFSIGTNDLIQYTIAVDRSNEKIAHLYQPCHPAVLHLIKITIDNGHKENIWVGLCGEIASIPEIACLLVGMGIDELSVAPVSIPIVKNAIRKIEYEKIKKFSEKIFNFNTNKEILQYIKNIVNS